MRDEAATAIDIEDFSWEANFIEDGSTYFSSTAISLSYAAVVFMEFPKLIPDLVSVANIFLMGFGEGLASKDVEDRVSAAEVVDKRLPSEILYSLNTAYYLPELIMKQYNVIYSYYKSKADDYDRARSPEYLAEVFADGLKYPEMILKGALKKSVLEIDQGRAIIENTDYITNCLKACHGSVSLFAYKLGSELGKLAKPLGEIDCKEVLNNGYIKPLMQYVPDGKTMAMLARCSADIMLTQYAMLEAEKILSTTDMAYNIMMVMYVGRVMGACDQYERLTKQQPVSFDDITNAAREKIHKENNKWAKDMKDVITSKPNPLKDARMKSRVASMVFRAAGGGPVSAGDGIKATALGVRASILQAVYLWEANKYSKYSKLAKDGFKFAVDKLNIGR